MILALKAPKPLAMSPSSEHLRTLPKDGKPKVYMYILKLLRA